MSTKSRFCHLSILATDSVLGHWAERSMALACIRDHSLIELEQLEHQAKWSSKPGLMALAFTRPSQLARALGIVGPAVLMALGHIINQSLVVLEKVYTSTSVTSSSTSQSGLATLMALG